MMMFRSLALVALVPALAFGQMEPEAPTPTEPKAAQPTDPKPEAKPAEPKPETAPTPAPKADQAEKKKKKKKAKKNKAKKRKQANSPFGNPEAVVKRLGLDEPTAVKARALIRELVTTQRETYKKQRELIGAAYRSFFQQMKTVLSPEQYRKLLQMRRNRRKGKGKQGKQGKGKQPNKGLRGRSGRALRALGATPEESAVLQPLIESVLHTRDLLRREERRRLAKLRKAMKETDEAALGKLLKQYRAARADADATLKKHEQQLVEVLTPAQELKLVGLGILR